MKSAIAVLVMVIVFSMTGVSGADNVPKHHPIPRTCTAQAFKPFSERVWRLSAWERGNPSKKVLQAVRKRENCAPPGHRKAMKATWKRDREVYFKHRHFKQRLAALNINYRWEPHWAPDYGGPTLKPYVIAALAEEAGDAVGVDVPGWTMEQVTIGESGRRPGSAGVDVGGTRGYGLWAITWPFADSILAKYGWTYEDMWNPVRNAVVMAEIYKAQGIGAWYGTGHVTSTDSHYRGRFDLRMVLGGHPIR